MGLHVCGTKPGADYLVTTGFAFYCPKSKGKCERGSPRRLKRGGLDAGGVKFKCVEKLDRGSGVIEEGGSS